MLFSVITAEWRSSVITITLFVAVIALYYVFLKNSSHGDD